MNADDKSWHKIIGGIILFFLIIMLHSSNQAEKIIDDQESQLEELRMEIRELKGEGL